MNFSIQKKNEVVDFVELNTTGDTENYNRCDEESLYLNNLVFCIFADCFERSNHLFDFITPTIYTSRHFISLKNELSENLHKLLEINNIQEFWEFIGSIHMGSELVVKMGGNDPELRKKWRGKLRHLIRDNNYLTRLIEHCIAHERVLWVIPY